MKHPLAAVGSSGGLLYCKADGVLVPLHGPTATLVGRMVEAPKPVGALMVECGLGEAEAKEAYALLEFLVDVGVLSTIGSWPAKPRREHPLA